MTTPRQRIAFTAILVLLPFVLLALLEGTISLGRFALGLRDRRFFIGEAGHTERDTLLGWINKPNLFRPNEYGKGKSLRIDAQRFRHDGDVSASPPPGRRRVVCSGDSFTYGDGVGDAENWCAMLAAADTALETINMGQVAYG